MATAEAIRSLLIEQLAWCPGKIEEAFYQNTPSTLSFATLRQSESIGAFGLFAKLPNELLHTLFMELTLKDLISLARTCLPACDAVEAFKPYDMLLQHSPQALAVLGNTRSLFTYQLKQLYAIMRTTGCSTCEDQGAFMTVLTGKRCCYSCLKTSPRFWTIPEVIACQLWRLEPSMMAHLPAIIAPDGSRLLNCMAVYQLSRHGPSNLLEDQPQQLIVSRICDVMAQTIEIDLHRPASPLSYNAGVSRSMLNRTNSWFDKHRETAVPMVAITNGTCENGLWCRGCDQLRINLGDDAFGSHLVAASGNTEERCVKRPLHSLVLISRTRNDFLKHITNCPGAQELVPELSWQLTRIQQLVNDKQAGVSKSPHNPSTQMSLEQKAELCRQKHIDALTQMEQSKSWTQALPLRQDSQHGHDAETL